MVNYQLWRQNINGHKENLFWHPQKYTDHLTDRKVFVLFFNQQVLQQQAIDAEENTRLNHTYSLEILSFILLWLPCLNFSFPKKTFLKILMIITFSPDHYIEFV